MLGTLIIDYKAERVGGGRGREEKTRARSLKLASTLSFFLLVPMRLSSVCLLSISVYLSVRVPACLSQSVCLSVCLSPCVCSSVRPSFASVSTSTCLSPCVCLVLSVLSVCLTQRRIQFESEQSFFLNYESLFHAKFLHFFFFFFIIILFSSSFLAGFFFFLPLHRNPPTSCGTARTRAGSSGTARKISSSACPTSTSPGCRKLALLTSLTGYMATPASWRVGPTPTTGGTD